MSGVIADWMFVVTACGYAAAALLFLQFLVQGKRSGAVVGAHVAAVATLLHAAHILLVALGSGQCPVRGVHVSMSLASMLMCAAYVLARKRLRVEVAGAFVAPLAFVSLLASRFVGRGYEPGDHVKSLVLPVHIAFNLLGVALFALAFSTASLYLVQEKLVKTKRVDGVSRRLPSLDALDRAEYRFLLAGFPLLTLGVATGTLWARRVELGASSDVLRAALGYVTWFVIAAVLFMRSAAGWRGRRAAYGTIAGFVCAVAVLTMYLARSHGGADAHPEPAHGRVVRFRAPQVACSVKT